MRKANYFSLLLWIGLILIILSISAFSVNETSGNQNVIDIEHVEEQVIYVNATEEEKALLEDLEITNPKIPYTLGFVSESFTPTEKIDTRIYSKIEDISSLQITNITPEYVKNNYTYGFIMILGKRWEYKLNTLENTGVKILGYHPRHSYKAKIPLNKINEIEQLPFVKWIGYSTDRQKFDNKLNNMYDNKSDTSKELDFFINLFDDDSSDEFKNILEKEGVRVIKYHPLLGSYYVKANLSTIKLISKFDFILSVELLGKLKIKMDQSGPSIATDYIRDDGYDGSGVRVGIIDTGFETDHDDLPNYDLCGDYTSGPPDCTVDPSGHGTKVACIFLGRGTANSKYEGVASGVNDITVVRLQEDDGSLEPVSDHVDAIEWIGNVSPTPEVVTDSIGSSLTDCNGTDAESRALDNTVYYNNVIYVAAAANDGSDPSTIGAPDCAKNAITVGNVYDYGDGQIDDIRSSSSRGPTGDGRQKPDIVAHGTYVTSCMSTNLSGYNTSSGTSYAAPQIAGIITSYIDHYPARSGDTSQIKAALLAKALNKGGSKSNIGNTYGFGKADAYIMNWNRISSDGWNASLVGGSLSSTGNWAYKDITVLAGTDRLTVVLVWHEPAASAQSDSAVINDLDLYVDKGADQGGGNTGEYYSNSTVDNVEYVSIDNPGSDTYRIKIYAKNIDPTVSPQEWDVGYITIRGDPTPPTTLTETVNDTSVYVNEEFTVTAKVEPSEYVASGVFTKVTYPAGVTVIKMETTREDGVTMTYDGSEGSIESIDRINLGNIHEGDYREVTWTLKATTTGTKSIGTYINSDNAGSTSTSINVEVATPPEVCNNGIDDDGDTYSDCADGDCTQGSLSQNGFCCGSGCSTNGGTCSDASTSGFTCTDGSCNTYSEACRNGELESSLVCSGTSLSCSGGSCEYGFGAPQWCDEITPSDTTCENSPGSYDELACEVSGTNCYYEAEYSCTSPSGCDEKDQDVCSTNLGFQCEWQSTYNDNVVEECESTTCGAISQCDEEDPGYDYTSCTTGGYNYFADQCSSICQGEDRGDNICRSSTYDSSCTADSQCNGITAGTGNCDTSCNYIDTTQPFINITSPINDTLYQTTSIDLNWTANETLDWCAYSLDGGANDTSICTRYTGFNFSVENQDPIPDGITWNGSSFFVVGTVNDRVYEYNSSGAYTGFNFSVKNQATTPKGIAWNGSAFFVVNTFDDRVYKYDSFGNHIGSFYTGDQTTNSDGITWNGSSFFVGDSFTNTVYEYDSFGTYTGFNFSIGGQDGNPGGITWNGKSLFIVGRNSDTVYEYLSSGAYTGFNFLISSEESSPTGITWNNNSLFVVGSDTDRVYEYKINNLRNITLTSLSEGFHNITIYGNDSTGNIGQSDYVYFNVTQALTPDQNKFYIKDNTNTNIVWFGDGGNIVIKGVLEQNSNFQATDNFAFVIRNNGEDVLIIENNGSMYIDGTLSENQAVINSDINRNDFRVKDSNGNLVININETGYVFLKGTLTENGNP